MQRRLVIAPVLALIALSGCVALPPGAAPATSGPVPPSTSGPPPTPSDPAPTAEGTPEEPALFATTTEADGETIDNEAGGMYLVREIDDRASIIVPDSDPNQYTVVFAVREIVEVECDSASTAGRVLVLSVEVETTSALDAPFTIGPSLFRAIAPGGEVAVGDASSACVSAGAPLPSPIVASSTAEGVIVIDVPADTEAIAFVPPDLDPWGWAWRLDASMLLS